MIGEETKRHKYNQTNKYSDRKTKKKKKEERMQYEIILIYKDNFRGNIVTIKGIIIKFYVQSYILELSVKT